LKLSLVAQILAMVLNYKRGEVQREVANNEHNGIQQTCAIIHESDNPRLSIRQLAKALSKIVTSWQLNSNQTILIL